MLEKLGACLRLSPGIATGTSLQSFRLKLGRLSNAIAPGILAVGVYHRTRRRHGQQYCPECLAENPAFLRHWRLAFIFICPVHGCLLRDACPNCDSPLAVHRSPGNDTTRCHVCQAPLARSSEAPTVATLAAQRVLLDAWAKEHIRIGSFTVSFAEWLRGLRLLFSALQHPVFQEHRFQVSTTRDERHAPLELSRVNKRSALLSAAVWFIGDWPQHLLRQHRKSPLHAGIFFDSRRTQKPAWLVETIQQNFPVQPQTRRPRTKIRIPRRLSSTLARRSLNLASVITHRLNQLQARH